MAKTMINAFNGGEVSPYSYARSDDPRYRISCLKMENFIPLSYGGAERRPALKAIPTFAQFGNDSILKEFVYNEDNAYLLRFNQYVIEIYLNDVLVYEVETPYLATALPELKFTQSNDVMFIAHKSYPVYILQRTDEDEFEFKKLNYVLPPMLDTITEGVTINPTASSGNAILNSDIDFFKTGHVDAFLLLEQYRDNKNGSISTVIDSSENCLTDEVNVSFCTYRVETSGKNWSGRVIIEKSKDGGKTYTPELVMVDNSAQKNDDTSAQASTYYDHTFATEKEEGANTFIRVRFMPTESGTNDPVIHIYPNSPYVKGLFHITQVVGTTQAKGTWLSPIQDVVSDYTNTSWSAGTTFPKDTKLKSVGTLTLDTAFPDGSGSATQAINTSASSEVNMTADAIDLTYDYVNNAIYVLNSAGKVNKYDYNRSTGAITFNSTRTFTYADGTGAGTNASASYFGIAFYNHPTYGAGIVLSSLDRVSGKRTYSQLNHITTWDKDDGGAGAAVTGTISSGTDGTIANRVFRNVSQTEYFKVFNMHGLSVSEGYAYWKQHRMHGSSKQYQATMRSKVDISTTNTNGINLQHFIVSSRFGSSSKTTYDTDTTDGGSGSVFSSSRTLYHPLMQEPYFSRDQIDTICVDGYLLCLNDVENRIDFRLKDYTLLENINVTEGTAMPPSSGTPEHLHGLCAIPKIITIGDTVLKSGSQYEIISLGGTGSNQSNQTGAGQPHWNQIAGTAGVTYTVGDTFTCVDDGESLHPSADGTVILHHNENLDNIRTDEVEIILLTRGTDNASGVLKRLTQSGEFNYYQATYEKSSDTTFKKDLDIGVWALRYPNITRITESAYSDYRGYPRAIAIHENRLCLAGTQSHPNRIWLSVSNDLNNFTVGEEATASLDLTINSLTQDEIQWLVSARELVIGTSQNEWSLGSGSNKLPITPLRFNLKRRTQYGSSYIQGQLVDSSILYFMRQREKLREWILQDNQEDYIASDLSLIAEHITNGGIIQMAVQRQPETIIWMVRSDGYLIGLTYNKETETYAWHKHNMLQADVKSIAVVPNASNEDDIYVEYEQTSGAQQNNNYLAKMDKRKWGTDHVTQYSGLDKYFMKTGFSGRYLGVVLPTTMAFSNTTKLITVDCSVAHNLTTGDVVTISDVQSSNSNTTYTSGVDPNGTYAVTVVDSDTFTYSGDGDGTQDESYTNETSATIKTKHLIHLAGATVIKKIDGVGDSSTTGTIDADGKLDLGSTLSNKTIVIGNSIVSTLAPLYLDVVTEAGSSKGSKKAIQKATIRFKDTFSAQVGQTETVADLDTVKFGSTSLNTEDAEVWLSNANEFLQTVYVIQRNPHPCTVLAMIPNVRVL